MTCKDCIHYDVCTNNRGETDCYDPTDDRYTAFAVEEECCCFKDKSLLVEHEELAIMKKVCELEKQNLALKIIRYFKNCVDMSQVRRFCVQLEARYTEDKNDTRTTD